MRALRICVLAWQGTRRSLTKYVLMSVLIAVGVSVFLVVTELSRASTADLQDAIAADSGEHNQYRVTFDSTLGLTPEALRADTRTVLDSLHPSTLQFVDELPSVTPQCPPYKDTSSPQVFVVRDAAGEPLPFHGSVTNMPFDLCFDGQVVPGNAMRETVGAEKTSLGQGLIIDPAYAPMVQLASTQPPIVFALVQFADNEDHKDQIETALTTHFAEATLMADASATSIAVMPVGIDAERTRAAADGVTLVYSLIAWGILGIVGLGILVAQLMTLRDKTWFLGLARAVGARQGDVALWVLFDVAILLVSGFGLAIVVCAVSQPLVSSFGMQAFNVPLQLLRLDAAPSLVLAIVVNLALGAGYPMAKALRLDPLEVLEKH
ncbi:hypothetical protein JT358_16015 [Micrococcales bacterium 31B]|nr:hypothetical protein [Micrococcales bacterium 31B]